MFCFIDTHTHTHTHRVMQDTWLRFDHPAAWVRRRPRFQPQHTCCLSLCPTSPDQRLLPQSTSKSGIVTSPLLTAGPPACWSYWKTSELLKEDGKAPKTIHKTPLKAKHFPFYCYIWWLSFDFLFSSSKGLEFSHVQSILPNSCAVKISEGKNQAFSKKW